MFIKVRDRFNWSARRQIGLRRYENALVRHDTTNIVVVWGFRAYSHADIYFILFKILD